EIISERTRDKKSAARQKGKWMGGYPVLGYDADAGGGRLVVNAEEAAVVRQIFAAFLRHKALGATLEEMQARGWRTKSWTTQEGKPHAGRPFDRPALVRLLSNVLYVGQVRHKGQVYAGEQEAIVDAEVWQAASALLRKGSRGPSRARRNGQG